MPSGIPKAGYRKAGKARIYGRSAFWSAENRIQRLRDLWDSGMPAAKIGIELSATKNAVIGMANRLGVNHRGARNGSAGKGSKTLFQRLDALDAKIDQVIRETNVSRIPGSAPKLKSATTPGPGSRLRIH